MVYYTVFNKKTIIVRNNVKNSMIKNFIHKLNMLISEKETDVHVNQCECDKFFVPQCDKSNIDMYSKVDQSLAFPCLSSECEWVSYQLLFHPKNDVWQLPGITADGVCVLCKLEREGKLDISKIKTTRNRISL